jgi:ribosomal protein S18 acetylase RimI-like enzyme
VAGFFLSVITLRTELIEFYERLGFERSGQFEDFPENPALWQPKVQSLALEYLVKMTRR